MSSLPTATLPTYNITTPTPYPLANGSVTDCYLTFENDWGNIDCFSAASNFDVSLQSFLLWNPSLGDWRNPPSQCTLQNETTYCGSFYNTSQVPVELMVPYEDVPADAGGNSTAECYDWWLVYNGTFGLFRHLFCPANASHQAIRVRQYVIPRTLLLPISIAGIQRSAQTALVYGSTYRSGSFMIID